MARDKIHNAVKNALIKDGWEITDDPYYIKDQDLVKRQKIAILVVNTATEEVLQWINWRDTVN